jgi:hypothetical protein
MTDQLFKERTFSDADQWLRFDYFVRALVSLIWVAAVIIIGPGFPFVAGALLLIYPAWDGLANVIDASHNGGLRRNPTQAINTAVSCVATVAVAIGLAMSMNVVLGIFGVWASLSGLLQLATAVRRWKSVGANGRWPSAARSPQLSARCSSGKLLALSPLAPSTSHRMRHLEPCTSWCRRSD